MKKYLLLPFALGFMLSCADSKSSVLNPKTSDSELSATVGAAAHGMVLFGTDSLFISHIPMFMSPHDWQALMQVQITHAQADALAIYKKASKPDQQILFTVRPKPFILPNLLSGKIKSFQADLYKGNFEKGGKLLLSDITVAVDSVLYSTQLSKATAAAGQLTYLAVETTGASYLVHKITAPQNFDHIVQIQWLTEGVERTAALQTFKVKDLESKRLRPGQYFAASEDGSMLESSTVNGAAFKVVADFYCTKGPDFYNLCD